MIRSWLAGLLKHAAPGAVLLVSVLTLAALRRRLRLARTRVFWPVTLGIYQAAGLKDCDAWIQHGSTSIMTHSLAVAYVSFSLAVLLGRRRHLPELIRAALLHDYFLYDWHDKNNGHRWHGFFHPRVALQNAETRFTLSRREANAILRHMFPLTPIPPIYTEGWLITLADKLCSSYETLIRHKPYPRLQARIKRLQSLAVRQDQARAAAGSTPRAAGPKGRFSERLPWAMCQT
ncbi:MAG: HD domain-containing protein [Oscillospiraceae bacterium]|nr:HD domain-containing protein [Oscillospiraceae bacterium]MDD4369383.1 HD domain-containing protein [Oscillospiraceae bacterium]